MPRILIDTDELRATATAMQADVAELADIIASVTTAWARTPAPPVQLLGIGARSGVTQARMGGLAAQLEAGSASLRVEAIACELGEVNERLYDLVHEGGRPFLEGVLSLLEGEVPEDWVDLLGIAMGGAVGGAIRLGADGLDTLTDALDIGRTARSFGGFGAEVGSVVPKLTTLGRFLGVAGVGLAAYDAVTGWDNIWKRERTDRGAGVEQAQDSAQVIGSGLVAVGGVVMLLPVPGAAQAVGGAMVIAGTGLKLAASAVDGYYYVRAHQAEVWNGVKQGWNETSDFVGRQAEGALNGVRNVAGGAGRTISRLLPP